jgi:peroxiredoxin
MFYQLLRQNGRILLKLEAIEDALRPRTVSAEPELVSSGLEPGTEAPPITLPDVNGGLVSLADFRGKRVLLIFFSPNCGFCVRMAPELAQLSADGPGDAPIPLVVSTGDVERNRELVKEHGIGCHVLRQKEMEVAQAYGVRGTPIGYLIDAEGRIASQMTIGAQALLALAQPASGEAPSRKADRDLSRSKIARDGLRSGTTAPPFRLPLVNGGDVALEDFAGKRLLLVFSDPHCSPCNELAPRLEALRRSSPGFEMLILSRGDPDENRKKVREHRLTTGRR